MPGFELIGKEEKKHVDEVMSNGCVLMRHGFDILSIEQDHIFPYQIEPYKRGEFVKEPWFEAMPDDIFNAVKKKLGWHLLITARRSR